VVKLTENYFVEGMVGAVTGFLSSTLLQALMPVFVILNPPSYFWLLLALVLLVQTVLNFAELFIGGIFYSIGLITAGALLDYLPSIIMGLIGVAVQIFWEFAREVR
jgi:hypothetical protein